MVELEIDMNQRIGEWATIQEAGSKLVPLYGPGYTGLANLGNSCYLNSIMQVVFSIPDFKTMYVDNLTFFLLFSPTEFDFNDCVCLTGMQIVRNAFSIMQLSIPPEI